jgi:hypothetical protein
MSITTVSAREFARDLAHAKRATTRGPVFVTSRPTDNALIQYSIVVEPFPSSFECCSV